MLINFRETQKTKKQLNKLRHSDLNLTKFIELCILNYPKIKNIINS